MSTSSYSRRHFLQRGLACERRSMPLGFYYSPPDLHHPGFRETSKLARENWRGEPERPDWPTYLNYMQLQLTELLTRYGDVKLIWFDGLNNQEKYDGRRVLDLIHRLQPHTLVNDRIGLIADYVTPEQFIPEGIPTKDVHVEGTDTSMQKNFRRGVPSAADFQLWETCMTINETWAYNAHDHKFKSANDLIKGLVEVASRGGNFLLNVGPQPDGRIQPEFQERLRAIGDWLAVNGEAIYDTSFGLLQQQPGFRTTAKNGYMFVHIFDWPSTPLFLADFKSKIISARLLANNRTVEFEQTDHGVKLMLPPESPDQTVNVVALRLL